MNSRGPPFLVVESAHREFNLGIVTGEPCPDLGESRIVDAAAGFAETQAQSPTAGRMEHHRDTQDLIVMRPSPPRALH